MGQRILRVSGALFRKFGGGRILGALTLGEHSDGGRRYRVVRGAIPHSVKVVRVENFLSADVIELLLDSPEWGDDTHDPVLTVDPMIETITS